MKRRLIWSGVVLCGAALLVGTGFWAGWSSGRDYPRTLNITDASNLTAPDGVGDMTPFWEVWQAVNESYLKNPDIHPEQKVQGAIKGLVNSLGDPYSEFFTGGESRKFQEDVRGNFGGIGAELGIRREQLTIVAPLKNTPASRVGLAAGDVIVKVNTSSTYNVSLEEAISWIRGVPGTDVTLNIFREAWKEPRDFKLSREVIQLPTLDFSMKEGVAHVALYSFNLNAPGLFADAVREATRQGARGMVLDLRNNPGGYLDIAVDLASWFVPRDTVVVSEQSRVAADREFRAAGPATLANFPMVVLINNGSASASEILAGALRDIRQVKLVGEKSFGKGTVQEILEMRDGSSLKLTIAHWVLPSGKILEDGGLEPDIAVELTEEDRLNSRDPQLDKALEIVRSEIKN